LFGEVAASASERIRLGCPLAGARGHTTRAIPTSRISLFMVSRRKTEPPRGVRRPELPEPDRRRTLRRRHVAGPSGSSYGTSSGHFTTTKPESGRRFPTPAAGHFDKKIAIAVGIPGGLNRPVTGSPPDPPRQRNARAGHRGVPRAAACAEPLGGTGGPARQADGILQPIEFGLDASAERRAALRAAQLRRRMASSPPATRESPPARPRQDLWPPPPRPGKTNGAPLVVARRPPIESGVAASASEWTG